MRQSIILPLIIVILAITAGGWWLLGPREGTARAMAVPQSVPTGATNVPDSRPAADLLPPSAMSSTFPLRVGDPLHGPKNAEEVAWLMRNGYTSQAHLEEALQTPPDKNKLNAKDGVSPEEVLMASQLAVVDPHSQEAAIEFLEEAALQGSALALEEMGMLFGHESALDPVQSEAYYRARSLRGDWTEDMRPRRRLSAKENLTADLMAQQIIDSIDRQRAQRRLPPLPRDLRPGLGAALGQIQAAEPTP